MDSTDGDDVPAGTAADIADGLGGDDELHGRAKADQRFRSAGIDQLVGDPQRAIWTAALVTTVSLAAKATIF